MSQESLQTFMVGIAALALLFQTVVLVAMALRVFKVCRSIDSLIAKASELVEIGRRSGQSLDVTLGQINRIVLDWTAQADTIARDLLDRCRIQAIAVDRYICDLILKVQNAVSEMERTVKEPFHEVHALGAGVRVALESLFSPSKSRTNGRGA